MTMFLFHIMKILRFYMTYRFILNKVHLLQLLEKPDLENQLLLIYFVDFMNQLKEEY